MIFVGQQDVYDLTEQAAGEMRDHGFMVADHKAEHLIVKPIDANVFGMATAIFSGYVDYELLERALSENVIRQKRRHGRNAYETL